MAGSFRYGALTFAALLSVAAGQTSPDIPHPLQLSRDGAELHFFGFISLSIKVASARVRTRVEIHPFQDETKPVPRPRVEAHELRANCAGAARAHRRSPACHREIDESNHQLVYSNDWIQRGDRV